MGVSCIAYTALSQSLMMMMFGVNHYTLSTKFAYEKEPYHGRQEYPPKNVPSNESSEEQPSDQSTDAEAAETLIIQI